MSCRVVRPLISAYLDHQLNPTETCLVENHLTYCTRCDEEYRAVREAKYAVRSLSSRVPTDISFRISARLQVEAANPQPLYAHYPVLTPPPYPIRRMVAASALSCLCLLFVAVPFAPATMEKYHSWRNARLPMSNNPFDTPILGKNDMILGIGPFTTMTGTQKAMARNFALKAWRVHSKSHTEMTVRNWNEQPFTSVIERPYSNSSTMMASFAIR